MATVYVFSSEGEQLLSKDHSFKIKAKPAPKPVIPAPKPVQVKPKAPADPVTPVKPTIDPQPAAPEVEANDAAMDTGSDTGNSLPTLPATQGEDLTSTVPSGAVVPPPEVPAMPVTPVAPAMPTEPDASQTQDAQSPQPTTQGEKP